MLIGYHTSHEQFPPSELLKYVQMAERAGFTAAMCSDHFHPWSKRQGHSGLAWAWLGAALQATSLPFGIVSSSGQRYHPAILAQAAATLAAPALTAARRFSHSEPGTLRGATVGSMRPRPERASDGREHTPNELLE
jgi:Luciferase-like monooxygenase